MDGEVDRCEIHFQHPSLPLDCSYVKIVLKPLKNNRYFWILTGKCRSCARQISTLLISLENRPKNYFCGSGIYRRHLPLDCASKRPRGTRIAPRSTVTLSLIAVLNPRREARIEVHRPDGRGRSRWGQPTQSEAKSWAVAMAFGSFDPVRRSATLVRLFHLTTVF